MRRHAPYLPLSCVVLLVCLCAPGKVHGGRVFAAELAPLKPGAPVDYPPLAFRPEVWKTKSQTTMLLPWVGSNVVFLTTNGVYDGRLMAHWVRALNANQEGATASLEFLRTTFGEVSEVERQRVRRQLAEYCGQDTEGMIWIVDALRALVGSDVGASTARFRQIQM